MPLGLTCASPKIVQAFKTSDSNKTFYHGHSFTGNPLSCAVAGKSLEILLREESQQNIQNLSNWQKDLALALSKHEKIENAQSIGTILRFEVKTKEETSYHNSLRDRLYQSLLKQGILMRPLGNVLYVLPPYVITKGELDQCYKAILKTLEEI
jgi:adenosylmethionine-8-amino-7-oxononanoate aminotransferase